MNTLNFFGVRVFLSLQFSSVYSFLGGVATEKTTPSIQRVPLYRENSNGPPEPQVNRGNSQMRRSLSC